MCQSDIAARDSLSKTNSFRTESMLQCSACELNYMYFQFMSRFSLWFSCVCACSVDLNRSMRVQYVDVNITNVEDFLWCIIF